jgi:hypothetical protein
MAPRNGPGQSEQLTQGLTPKEADSSPLTSGVVKILVVNAVPFLPPSSSKQGRLQPARPADRNKGIDRKEDEYGRSHELLWSQNTQPENPLAALPSFPLPSLGPASVEPR